MAIKSLAMTDVSPAFPRPKVLALTCPPLVKDIVSVIIVTPPASPNASSPTIVKAPLATLPCEFSPSMLMPFAVISTEPAFPRPKVPALTCPPLVKDIVSVTIVTPPASPNASSPTIVKAPLGKLPCKLLSSILMPFAVISTEPAFP